MKKFALFVKLAAIALLLVAGSSTAFAQAKPPRVALVMKSLANEFFLTMETGAKAHQKQSLARYELLTNGIKGENDTAGAQSSISTWEQVERFMLG